MTLFCVLCLFIRRKANQAVTVTMGFAVCDDHLQSFGMSTELAQAITRQKAEDPLSYDNEEKLKETARA